MSSTRIEQAAAGLAGSAGADPSSLPLVTIITAVFNGARHVREAIESVLAQDYPALQYIVIDGGSTDGTQAIVGEYRDRIDHFVSERDSGLAEAWNKGVAAARGDYVAFLNADDVYQPSFVRRSVAACRRDEREVVFGNTLVISEDGEPQQVLEGRFDADRLARGFGFRHPSCLTSRGLFDAAGGFDVRVRIAVDTDFLLRCVRAGATFRGSRAVVRMRRGGMSDRHWGRAAHEYIGLLVAQGFLAPAQARRERRLVALRQVNRALGLMPWLRGAKTQAYFFGLRVLNLLHGVLPFFARRGLYRLAGFDIDANATLQGGVRFFHVGRLKVGPNTVVNRDVFLDNRVSIRIGAGVSIAHGCRIYSLGHEIHDDLFEAKGAAVDIGDHAVMFAGAMLMPGVHLGEGAVALAGAVVTRDVPAYRVVGGNPACDLGPRDSDPVYLLSRRYWWAH